MCWRQRTIVSQVSIKSGVLLPHKEEWWAKRAAISLVSVPSIDGFQGLNAHWQQRCLERMDDRLRGQSESFSQRMELGLEALLPLPDAPYDPCDQQAGRVSSLSGADKGLRGCVVISSSSEVIARHPRSYERDDFVYDPIHYLPFLDRKTAALD